MNKAGLHHYLPTLKMTSTDYQTHAFFFLKVLDEINVKKTIKFKIFIYLMFRAGMSLRLCKLS